MATTLVLIAAGAAVAFYPLTVVVIPAVLLAAAAVVYFFRDPVGVLIGFLIFEVVQTPLAAIVGYSNGPGHLVLRADEVIMLVLLVLTLTQRLTHPSSVRVWRYIAAGVVFAAAGLASDFVQHVPPSISAVGGWLQLKWWVLLAIGLMTPWTERDRERVLNTLMRIGLVLSALGVVDLVAQGPFRRLLHTNKVSLTLDPRAAHAVESIFTTPSQFSIVMAMLMTVAVAARITRRGDRYGLYAVIFGGMALLSLRVTAVFAVTAAAFIVWILGSRSFGGRALAVIAIALLATITFTLFKSEINSHLTTYSQINSTNARGELYATSVIIAKQHAPLGSGFGTFASGESRQHYSQLYVQYGLSGTYGLSRADPQFIDDTMWPAILGETGYIGLLAVIFGLLELTRALVRRVGTVGADNTFPLAAIGLLVVALVNSVANPVMFDGLNSAIFALVAAPALVIGVEGTEEVPADERVSSGDAFSGHDRLPSPA